MLSFSISLIILSVNYVRCWNLTEYGFGNDYYTSGIAYYHHRAFLALPRSICNKNVSNPTLVEVSWTEDTLVLPNFLRIKIPLDSQTWGNCEHLQDAISVSMESIKPHLWVLDKGNKNCPAKLVSFNLFLNSLHHKYDLSGIPGKNLNTMIIDPFIKDQIHVRAYIGDVGDNTLLVVSLQDFKWWRLQLIEKSEPFMVISASFLAISKTSSFLYMTGWNSTELFEMDLKDVRESDGPLTIEAHKTFIQTNVTFLGNKLGVGRSLETDYKSGLSYYLVRDYAVTRWQTDKPCMAEHHSILAQSFPKLPYVSQLITGPQLGLWALINPIDPDKCYLPIKDEEKVTVNHRIVRLLKYNKFFL